ncbi:esterase/lipase family protein [Phytoactinopolyspora halotolerans]|uniref:Lipase n=1 Tax=Phytoactinopolyspora halotolerans TaxID=1981512 RepID=A0A6L9SD32_9ACTN|nr:lipase [Phytoactinopolyspora halotolerans]NEE02997.1 lipase [Phytoactinopolyspora halotolerans]
MRRRATNSRQSALIRVAVAAVAVVVAVPLAVTSAVATSTDSTTTTLTLTQTATPTHLQLLGQHTSVANGWELVEHFRDTRAGFSQEQFPPDGRGDQDGQRVTFFGGDAKPHSSEFLLYHAPGWNAQTSRRPVLLVHGANDTPDRAWANPGESGDYGCGRSSCPGTGLMQQLVAEGVPVFAVGFAHKQGDNLMQAQHVGNAIAMIREKLGVGTVDVIGWSKGMMSARMYVSSVRPPGGSDYAGDVGKLILLGGPNGGYDYPYAHGWAHNVSIWPECGGSINAPSPHTRMTCYGLYTYHPEFSFVPESGWDAYPGQRQMLARWDGVYGVNTAAQDWYTTYYGGQGFYTRGQGIQAAIDAGSLIAQIQAAGTPASVEVYLLAGGSPTVTGIWNETRGPSDGVVFVDSALDTTGVGNVAGTRLAGSVNHLELGWHPTVRDQVISWLS